MLENYCKSYTNGAIEFSGDDNVWPHAYDATSSGEQSIEDYTNEKYFKINSKIPALLNYKINFLIFCLIKYAKHRNDFL